MLKLADIFELNINKSWKKQSTGYRTIFKDILALTSKSKYVFFDEPILGLDATHRDMFYQLMLERFELTRCFVISTHLIEEVSKLIDSVKLIHHGKLIIDEDKETLLSNVHKIILNKDESIDLSNVTVIEDRQNTLGRSVIYKGELNFDPNRLSDVDLQDYFIAISK